METLHQHHLTDLRRQAEEQLNNVMASLPDRSPEDMQALLYDLHVHQIELTLQNEDLRRAQTELAASRSQYIELYRQYANLYEFAPVGYCTLNEAGSIRNMNLTAAQQLGAERSALLNTRVYRYICEDDRDACFAHLRAAFSTGFRQTCELRLRKQDGTLFWAYIESIVVTARRERFSAPSQDADAPMATAETVASNQCLTTISDISIRKHTEELLKTALRDKDLLMKEILHRTKNNMGAIISLLHLLAFRHEEYPQILDIFQNIEQRIHAMLLVQQQLYQSEHVTEVNLKIYLDELSETIFYNLQDGGIQLIIKTEAVLLPPDGAIACGLLLTELLTNALKYAFPPSRASLPEQMDEIYVTLQRCDADMLELRVSDNGVGLPPDFDPTRQKSLGCSLIAAFTQQLRGTLKVTSDHGTRWCIRFPQPSPVL